MVALNKNIVILFAVCLCSFSARAQQIQPRIVGLEKDSTYMALLTEDNRLTLCEDSIVHKVESLREIYRNNPSESTASREQIISLENKLFELRAKKAVVIDNLNVIEQEWVLENMEVMQPIVNEPTVLVVEGNEDVKYIYENPNIKLNLSSLDYKNLIKAEEREAQAEDLSNSFTVNYDNMLSLSRSYQLTSSQSEAIDIMERFNSLARANEIILTQLGDVWGYIYDNKSFAYSMVMEVLGFSDALQQEADLMRSAQAEIATKLGQGCSDEQMRYFIQKSSMVKFELIVAQKLGLNAISSSLELLLSRLNSVAKSSLPHLSLEERLFLNYEPIVYVKTPLYNAANPIPRCEIYERGTIFRIFVGSFTNKQTVATFRNATPLYHRVNSEGRHCYYIGGFDTYESAVTAQSDLKEHGFRAPQIVVWVDGRERNLTKEPIEMHTSYRIDIENAPSLPVGASERLVAIAPEAIISKVGLDKYVITSLNSQESVDALVAELSQIGPEMKVVVEKSEAKIEF